MNRWLAAGLVVAGMALAGTGIYRMSKGGVVEPAVVADFNKDGKDDILYLRPLNLSGTAHEMMFVDGEYVSREDNKYMAKNIGRFTRVVLPSNMEYEITAEDADGDSNLDMVLRDRNLISDPIMYTAAREVYLEMGMANLSFPRNIQLLVG